MMFDIVVHFDRDELLLQTNTVTFWQLFVHNSARSLEFGGEFERTMQRKPLCSSMKGQGFSKKYSWPSAPFSTSFDASSNA